VPGAGNVNCFHRGRIAAPQRQADETGLWYEILEGLKRLQKPVDRDDMPPRGDSVGHGLAESTLGKKYHLRIPGGRSY
jgi:hypothetical protein